MRHAITNRHPFYDIYVSETNMGFWKVVMEAVYHLVSAQISHHSQRRAFILLEHS